MRMPDPSLAERVKSAIKHLRPSCRGRRVAFYLLNNPGAPTHQIQAECRTTRMSDVAYFLRPVLKRFGVALISKRINGSTECHWWFEQTSASNC